MRFYTNVSRFGNDMLVRGYDKGERFQDKVKYAPTLYVPSQTGTLRSVTGKTVKPVSFDTMSHARSYVEKFDGVSGAEIYGFHGTSFIYSFIHEYFPDLDYDITPIKIANIDIEVETDKGFPDIQAATQRITAITVKTKHNGNEVYLVFGTEHYQPKDSNVNYFQCEDEPDLLRKFLKVWEAIDPDIITGWNVEMFDIPYMVNRFKRVLGEDQASRLSPWGKLQPRNVVIMNKNYEIWNPVGISILDYLALYRKFTYSQQESYKLDHIAHVELGERKLDYSDVADLNELYEKDFERFIDYNIKDVGLVDRLDDKLNLIQQALAIAYDAKVNYQDAFTSVRMWDVIIHNYLMDQGIVVPNSKPGHKDSTIEGAFVKTPQVGMHKWVVSFDLNSLYPHLIMQYNISPETYRGKIGGGFSPEDINRVIDGYVDTIRDRVGPYALTGNGCLWDRDFQGFLPELMQRMYNDRTKYKQAMLEAKQAYESDPSFENEKLIAKNNNMQMAKKIQLNSGYGALSNIYFRYFNRDMAEAITMSGQVSIKWMEKKINEYLNKLFKTEGTDYVLACDTDSMYITLDRLVHQVFEGRAATPEDEGGVPTERVVDFLDRVCQEKIEPYIDRCYQELAAYMNAYEQKMFMKRENIADKAIWTAKKRYIMNVYDSEGVRYAEPKLKMMGIEAVKSSTPTACRQKIKETLNIIMTKGESETQRFIKQFRKQFRDLPFEDIAFPRSVKDLSKYVDNDEYAMFKKGTPIHVKGSILYNEYLKKLALDNKFSLIYDGDKIKFCYLKMPNPVRNTVIACPGVMPKEFGLEKYIDYETQFNKSYVEPIKTILEAINWQVEPKATLEDFFI